MMKLIVGIGNPGEEYAKTRHNVGFMVLDALALKTKHPRLKTENTRLDYKKKLKSLVLNFKSSVILAKPQILMNNSGIVVKKLVDHLTMKQLNNLYVIHDDLDIKLGEYKIQFAKGPKEHKGLLSIYKELDTKDFWHVRVGVDNRVAGTRIPGEDYVLQYFNEAEIETRDKVVGEVVNELKSGIFKSK